MNRDSRTARWIPVGIALALIVVATLTPVAREPGISRFPFWCLACGTFGGADILANVALFVPLGWAIGFAGMSRWRGVLLVLAVTVVVELLQHTVIPGRWASFSDILTDTAGALWGMGLFILLRWVVAHPVRALRAAAVYGALLAAIVVGGIGLQATAAPRSLYWTNGSLDGRPDDYKAFTGSVRDVQLDGSALVKVELLSGRADATPAELVWFGAVEESPPGRRGFAWLDQFGRDLHVHIVSAADGIGLRGHSPVLTNALPNGAGETIVVQMIVHRFAYHIAVRAGAGELTHAATISPGDGWKLLTPFARAWQRWKGTPLLTGLWMAGLLAPLGYLSAARPAATATAMAGASAYFVVLPIALGCAWLPVTGWAGAAGGFLIGRFLRR